MWNWSVLYCTHQYRNDKSAKFHLQDLNSRTFQGFSSTFKHPICFQALSRASKFLLQIQAFSSISQARYCVYQSSHWLLYEIQEAQLSQRDRAMRCVNWNLANCQATVQKLLIRQVLTKLMVWSWRFSRRQCVIDNVHSTMTRWVGFHCLKCHKQTDDVELCISPVYRRLAVAKFSKSTM